MTPELLAPYVPRLLRGLKDPKPGAWQGEGTLVFADVSGFTRLTEKLAHQGRRGSEEMVTTISEVFTALLRATTDGGDVLKFGGDALLLFYQGDDHAQRACHAALTMQRELRRVGGIDTSRGRVRLRMSIGVHSGRFHLLLCGGGHLELHVLGADATTTTALEAAADPGEVLTSPATAALLDGVRVTAGPGDALRVRSVPSLPPVPVPDLAAGPDVARFVPPVLRAHLAHAEHDSEHRRATVAFVAFAGVDELLARGRTEQAFDRVQTLTDGIMDALATYEVLLTATDIGSDGGKFMLTAGAPRTTGDEEARMLRVARRAVEIDCGLPVRVGVNAGNVFVGAVGAPHRRTYSTMGDATNTAARVMGRAEPGTVLATRTVTAEVAGRFAVTPRPRFFVKGKSQAVDSGIVGPAVVPAAGTVSDAPLVGRDQELATLSAGLADARSGAGRVVELIGGEGTGKSRLVAEVKARAGEVQWWSLVCDPYEQATPYAAARRLLRQALDLSSDADPATVAARLEAAVIDHAPSLRPWFPLLADVAGLEVTATDATAELATVFRTERTVQATADLLAVVAGDTTVLAIEDATAMDDASAEVLAEVLRRVPELGWLAVVTRVDRPEGLHAGRGYEAGELRLGALPTPAIARLAARLAEHHPVPAHLLDDLVERAGGNPMVLEALVVAQATAGADTQLPRSVEAIYATRIDALAAADRRVLRYLSVLGDRFEAAVADEVLDRMGLADDAVWQRLEDFFVHDGDTVGFRAALIRQVAYEGLSFRRRQQLHGLAAAALSGRGGDRAPVALHHVRAGHWDRAWRHATAAGDDAERRGAHVEAGRLFDLALTAAPHLPDLPSEVVFDVALTAGAAWRQAGLHDQALAAYTQAGAVAPDDCGRIEVTLCRAAVHEQAGRYTQALQAYGRALSAAEELVDSPARHLLVARSHTGYAAARLGQGQTGEAIKHGTAAVTALRDSGEITDADDHTNDGAADHGAADHTGLLAHAYHLLDRAHTAAGDPDTAARYRDLALPLFAAQGDLVAQGTVLFDLGADAQRRGQQEVALWLYERSREARTRAGDVVGSAAAVNAIGEVLAHLGRQEDAAERFTEALRTWRGARSLPGVALALGNLGALDLAAGDADSAVARLTESRRLAQEAGAEPVAAQVTLSLAEALVPLGRVVEAWEAATAVLAFDEGVDETGRARAHLVRAEALAATGGDARAAEERSAATDLQPPIGA